MPLLPGKSKEAFTHNIKAEISAGKPQAQALAIAYSEKRKHMAQGGIPLNNKLRQSKVVMHASNPHAMAVSKSLKPMAEGGNVEPMEQDDEDVIMDHVVDEFMEAFEKKDKALLKDALKALVLSIMDEDKEQDEGEES